MPTTNLLNVRNMKSALMMAIRNNIKALVETYGEEHGGVKALNISAYNVEFSAKHITHINSEVGLDCDGYQYSLSAILDSGALDDVVDAIEFTKCDRKD